MPRYWLGPVPWVSDAAGDRYEAPAGVAGWLDLRSLAQCGTPNTVGNGFFATAIATNLNDQAPAGVVYTNLGTDLTRVLTAQQRTDLAAALNLPQAPASSVLGEIVYEALTSLADPTGQDRVAPLVPTDLMRFEVWLAGQRIISRPFRANGPEAASVQEVLRRTYRRIRQAVLDGNAPENHHRKALGYWLRQYRRHIADYRWFQPADVPDESPLEPSTTITDNFNRADADALGSSSEGWSWTEVAGDVDIVSNTATQSSGDGLCRAELSLSSDNHYAQMDTTGVNQGALARFNSAAQTFYMFRNAGDWQIHKCVTGAFTLLTNTAGGATGALKIECNGSTVKGYRNGAEVLSVTDSSITGNLRTGFRNSGGAVDNFEASDLTAEVAATPTLALLGVGA